MYRAIWNDVVLAESDHTVKVEGNHYFPPDSLNKEFFSASPTTSQCAWKGSASSYTITVSGKVNKDAAWFYAHPSPAAEIIRDRVAFWKGVRILEVPRPDSLRQTCWHRSSQTGHLLWPPPRTPVPGPAYECTSPDRSAGSRTLGTELPAPSPRCLWAGHTGIRECHNGFLEGKA